MDGLPRGFCGESAGLSTARWRAAADPESGHAVSRSLRYAAPSLPTPGTPEKRAPAPLRAQAVDSVTGRPIAGAVVRGLRMLPRSATVADRWAPDSREFEEMIADALGERGKAGA
jgi:hypothetical protein